MKKILSIILTMTILAVSIFSVRAAVIGGENNLTSNEPLNSWRYTNGVPNNAQTQGLVSVGSSCSWTKTSNGFVNSDGKVIKGATMKGIDVSQWNGKIDWAKVAKTDVDYAIIRVGYGMDYKSQDDSQFHNNVRGCIANKIPFGVYIYSYASNTAMAKSEAEHTLRLIKGYKLNFPVYYDLEDYSQTKLSKKTIGAMAKTFCNTISNAGYQVGIYANLNWWNNYLTDPVFNNSSWYKWVAQYNSACTYTKSYTMWQCSCDGRVNGINGLTDLNFWYGTPRSSSYKTSFSGVTLSRETASIYRTTKAYGKYTLKANVTTSSSNKSVRWVSSDTKIATVDSKGVVTAKRPGKVKITAIARFNTNKRAVCEVTVKLRMDSFSLNRRSMTFKKGGLSSKLVATCSPKNASNQCFEWITTNKKVATVDSKGNVKSVGKGVCYICATSKDGSNLTEVCRITVNA